MSKFIDKYFYIFSVGPTVLTMFIVFGIPLGFSFYLSLHGWTPTPSLGGGPFVGLQNYIFLLEDSKFIQSTIFTIVYTVVVVSIELLVGLSIALLLNQEVPLIRMARSVLAIPMMVTPIVAALCWKLLLDPQYGFINYLIGQKLGWTGDPFLAPITVAIVNVWQNAPYVGILLLAGLRSLPSDPKEAAAIDGASAWQTFWNITLPGLRPMILVALLLRTIFEFRTFENVYVLTGGGPAGATNVLSIYTYGITFGQLDFTYGAASSWMMLVTVAILCSIPILLFRAMDRGRA